MHVVISRNYSVFVTRKFQKRLSIYGRKQIRMLVYY